MPGSGEKTEKPTDKRRGEERKKGHVTQSADLVTAASMLCIFGVLKATGPSMLKKMSDCMNFYLQNLTAPVRGFEDIKNAYATVIYVLVQALLPIVFATVLATVAVTFAQTRFLVTPGQVKPDFKRLNPIQGIKRLFSFKSIVELLKSMLKIAAIGLIVFFDIKPKMTKILLLFDTDLHQSLSWIAQTSLDIGFKVSMAMLVIGVADYFYQWWSYEHDIMMTKEEIKEEYKQSEGNPEVKSRIRGLQRKFARSRMMQEVPKADVVIRNPTHYAVALKYDEKKTKAPVVVAKGKNNVALKIVEIAENNKVYITENIPLAQALFKTVEIGEEIPVQFYKAVAEILAYIYKLRRAGRK